MLDNVGIFPVIWEFMHTVIYRRIAAVFRTFRDKKAAEGNLMTLYAQERKCVKVRTKREFVNTITRVEKVQIFR